MSKHKNLEEILLSLPVRSFSLTGKPCEPVTLIIKGSKPQVQKLLISGGWSPAVGINPFSAARALTASILNLSYPSGPISPTFIYKKPQQMAFQRPTKSNTFRRRHHLRLWKTNFYTENQPVWVGTISYDRSSGLSSNHLFPTHHISSALESEESFLAKTLGIKDPEFIAVTEPEEGHISNGDPYRWDGKMLLIKAR